MKTAFYSKSFILFLSTALLVVTTFPGRTEAMFVPSAVNGKTSAQRDVDIAKVHKALESRVIQQKLMDLGLSREEAVARMNGLSTEQVHELATHTESIQAGGNAALLAVYIFAALAAIYVVGTVVAGIVGAIMIKRSGKSDTADDSRSESGTQAPEPKH